MKYYFIVLKNWIAMLWYWSIAKLDIKLSTETIPNNTPYCYGLDDKNFTKSKDDHTIYTTPCNYYKHLGNGWNGCGYLGIVTDDMIFDDQCKMCGEKKGYGDDYVSDDYVS